MGNTDEEMFIDDRAKSQIVQKVLNWGLVQDKSALIVGTGSSDYLPAMLFHLGIDTSFIEVEPSVFNTQNSVHREFGLDNEIDAFSSYDDLGSRIFDYVFVLGVFHEVLLFELATSPQLRLYFQMSLKDIGADIAKKASDVHCMKIVLRMTRQIVEHVNPHGGHLFYNATLPAPSAEECRRGIDIPCANKSLLYLDNALKTLSGESGIVYSVEEQIDVDDFGICPKNIMEKRRGIVYKVHSSPLTLKNKHPISLISKNAYMRIKMYEQRMSNI